MSWISTQFSHHWRNFNIGAVIVLSIGLVFGPSAIRRITKGVTGAIKEGKKSLDEIQKTVKGEGK